MIRKPQLRHSSNGPKTSLVFQSDSMTLQANIDWQSSSLMKSSTSSNGRRTETPNHKGTCCMTNSRCGSIPQNSLATDPKKRYWVLLGQIKSTPASCLVGQEGGNISLLMTFQNGGTFLLRTIHPKPRTRRRRNHH